MPLVVSAVLLFGCCVLPFHHIVHRLMPLCQTAMGVLHDEHRDEMPAREKPQQRLATELPQSTRIAIAANTHAIAPVAAATSYRSFITLGAVRCDRDVGLHELNDLYLI